MLVYRCQGFFALTTFGTFLAGLVKSSIGFSFFCCSCICSACPSAFLAVHRSVWISICSAGLPACCSAWSARSSGNASGNASGNLVVLHIDPSAYLAIWQSGCAFICICSHLSAILSCHSVLPFCSASLFCRMCICCLPERISAVVRMPALLLEHLAAILPVCRHICTNVCPGGWISACLVARLSVWRSARSLVCSSGCIWQRVWSHINLPGNLSARRPVLEAVHLAAHSGAYSARLSIWSSAGLFCCLQAAISSICLFHRPGANPSLHLPILAGHEPILAICLLIQLQLAASGSFSIHLQDPSSAGRGFVDSSAIQAGHGGSSAKSGRPWTIQVIQSICHPGRL